MKITKKLNKLLILTNLFIFVALIILLAILITFPKIEYKDTLKNAYNNTIVIQTIDNVKGSGFVYKTTNDKAYILTNYHVVENNKNVIVSTINNDKVTGKVIGTHKNKDIAVIEVENKYNFKPISISKNNISIGEEIYTIGTPFDLTYRNTVSKGIISGLDREILNEQNIQEDIKFIQIDAKINPGNSGGPLLNSDYKVIGIISKKIVYENVDSINLAIPIKDIIEYLDSLENNKIK